MISRYSGMQCAGFVISLVCEILNRLWLRNYIGLHSSVSARTKILPVSAHQSTEPRSIVTRETPTRCCGRNTSSNTEKIALGILLVTLFRLAFPSKAPILPLRKIPHFAVTELTLVYRYWAPGNGYLQEARHFFPESQMVVSPKNRQSSKEQQADSQFAHTS